MDDRKPASGLQDEGPAISAGNPGYMKKMRSEALAALMPDSEVPPGIELWTLFGSDGEPIVVSESRDALIGHAFQNALATASLH
ncbi:MAG: DUF1150 family protein [Hyphomicrobiaceae bacterium]|nr:DUF1150 family protein [Hyphomicrobiaceae bacterium]